MLLFQGQCACLSAPQRPGPLPRHHPAFVDFAGDDVEQTLRRRYRRPSEPPVRRVLTAKTVLEPDSWLTLRELVQGGACCGYVVRMDEREKRLIEQLCFDIPECWWERWRDAL